MIGNIGNVKIALAGAGLSQTKGKLSVSVNMPTVQIRQKESFKKLWVQSIDLGIFARNSTEFAILRRRTDIWLRQSSPFSDDI